MVNITLVKIRATEVVNGFSTVKHTDCVHMLNIIEELEREQAANRRLKNALAESQADVLKLTQENKQLLTQNNYESNMDFFHSYFGDKQYK